MKIQKKKPKGIEPNFEGRGIKDIPFDQPFGKAEMSPRQNWDWPTKEEKVEKPIINK